MVQGSIYRRQGKLEESLAAHQKLLAMNPRNSLTACEIGATYRWMRKYVEAQQYFDLCISLGPEEENGYLFSVRNYVLWKGDTKSAREILSKLPQKEKGLFIRFLVELWDRRYQKALDVLSSPHVATLQKSLLGGMVYRLLNKPELARASFDSARRYLENELRNRPDDHDLRRFLGIAYAGLGQKKEAIREGKRAAVELLPLSKDALSGSEVLKSLAFIYVLVGEENAAIDQIEYLLSIPANLSVPLLRIDPSWDPLRNNPRFQKLLESY